MIDTYINFLTYEKRSSSDTLAAYSSDLEQFRLFMSRHRPDTAVMYADAADIRAWVVSLISNNVKPRSVNRKISCLRSFYKFLQLRGKIKANPTFKIKALKAKYPLPFFMQVKEILNLLEGDHFTHDFSGYRDRLIIEFFYGTGTRLSEMINFRTENIDWEKRTLKIEGKGGKHRIIPCYSRLLDVTEKYLAERARVVEAPVSFLLLNDKGSQCTKSFVYHTVRKYLDQFTTIEKRSPHVLRHTYATHLLENGADLNAIKDLLGHASLASTQIYTHNSLDQLRSAFDQAHPKA